MCIVSFLSFIMYYLVCNKKWRSVVRFKLYNNSSSLYKEILVFNNYTAMGAAAVIGKSQGGNLLVNYFFGTIVNGAFAIAYQVDNYVYMFVNKLTLASNPQIAKNYSKGTIERSNTVLEKNTKYSILIMIVFYFTLVVDLDYILELWLGDVPDGTTLFCFLTLTSALVRSFSEGTNGYIQASGKIKWFQILSSITLLISLPIAYVLFYLKYDAYWILICYIATDLLYRIISLVLMYKILGFNIYRYIRKSYASPICCICIMIIVVYFLQMLNVNTFMQHFCLILITCFSSICSVFLIGLDKREKSMICNFLKR